MLSPQDFRTNGAARASRDLASSFFFFSCQINKRLLVVAAACAAGDFGRPALVQRAIPARVDISTALSAPRFNNSASLEGQNRQEMLTWQKRALRVTVCRRDRITGWQSKEKSPRASTCCGQGRQASSSIGCCRRGTRISYIRIAQAAAAPRAVSASANRQAARIRHGLEAGAARASLSGQLSSTPSASAHARK